MIYLIMLYLVIGVVYTIDFLGSPFGGEDIGMSKSSSIFIWLLFVIIFPILPFLILIDKLKSFWKKN